MTEETQTQKENHMITLNLSERVSFFQTTKERGLTGSFTNVDKNLITLWAEVNSIKGSDVIQNGEMFNAESIYVVIRYRKSINEKLRVHYDDKVFAISHIQKLGKRDGLKLLCTKIDA